MRVMRLIVFLGVIAGLAGLCCGGELVYDANELRVFDTVTSYESALSSLQIKNKQGWKQIVDEEIRGDLCIENNKMAVVLRRACVGAEAYYKIGTRFVKAVTLYPLGAGDDAAVNIESFKVISRDEGDVILNTTFRTESGELISIEQTIRAGEASIEIRPGQGGCKIVIQAKADYTIMPDLFADDLVIEPQRVRVDKLYLPADNRFLLHMIDNGDGIIVCNWPGGDGEIAAGLSKNRNKKLVTETTISFENNGKVWVSLMGQKGIWHQLKTSRFNIYEHSSVEWTVPFEAYWRANYRRSDSRAFGFTDSFWNAKTEEDGTFKLVRHLLDVEIVDGEYMITGLDSQKRLVNRSVANQHTGGGWWSYRGWFIQPFYINGGRAFVKIPRFDGRRSIRYGGAIVIYPLLSVDSGSEGSGTIEDVLYNTFGGEYLSILDLADLNKRCEKDRYPPTCTSTEYCEKIFDRNEEVEKRKQIAEVLGQMNLFVKHTQQRIEEYVDWEKEMQVLYKENSRNPKLGEVIRAMKSITRQIPLRFSRNRKKMKTPQHISGLSAKAVSLIGQDSSSKGRRHKQIRKQMCKQIFKRIRYIGNAQDELLGECRNTVKMARQKVSILHTQESDAEVRKFLRLVRGRTQKILRIRYDMEGK